MREKSQRLPKNGFSSVILPLLLFLSIWTRENPILSGKSCRKGAAGCRLWPVIGDTIDRVRLPGGHSNSQLDTGGGREEKRTELRTKERMAW